jgi:hypothetical protein
MRALHGFALASVLLGGAGLAWFLLADRGAAPPPLELATATERGKAASAKELTAGRDDAPKGGVYAGIVVDEAGNPIPQARVLLVRFNAGDEFVGIQQSVTNFDPAKVPTIGDFHVSGDEQTTDAGGRFRIASGARDRVQYAVAWKDLYAPGVKRTGRPEDEVRIVLKQGGLLKGKVVDPSGSPVAGATVEINLQQKSTPVKEGERQVVKPNVPAEMGLLGSFLGKVLGPKVWGFQANPSESLRTVTPSDGTFHFGPVDDSVQVEVWITHPDYMWTEFDRGPDQLVRRSVLEPGKTLERTYVLQPGNWIEGRVVSDEDRNRGIEGVWIRLEHVVGYAMHPLYKIRTRNTTTREDGSFRIAGLAQGPYVATMSHPSFGSKFQPQIPENSKGLLWFVKGLGAIRGELHGLEERPLGGRVELVLEPTGSALQGPQKTPRSQFLMLSTQNAFEAQKIEPGEYRASVRAGKFASTAQLVTVEPHKTAHLVFETAGSGTVTVRVEDGQGKRVDPVTLTLVRLEEGKESTLGSFTTRSGVLEDQVVLPGTYRLEAWAAGFLPGKSDTFTVALRQAVRLPTIVLRRPGWMKLLALTDERDRPPKEPTLEIREGDGEFRPAMVPGAGLQVAPGPLTVRITSQDGLVFEQTYEVEEGKFVEVRAVLKPK